MQSELEDMLSAEAKLTYELASMRQERHEEKKKVSNSSIKISSEQNKMLMKAYSPPSSPNGISSSSSSGGLVTTSRSNSSRVREVQRQRQQVQMSMQQKAFHLERLLVLETALLEEERLMQTLTTMDNGLEKEEENITISSVDKKKEKKNHNTIFFAQKPPVYPQPQSAKGSPVTYWDSVSKNSEDENLSKESKKIVESEILHSAAAAVEPQVVKDKIATTKIDSATVADKNELMMETQSEQEEEEKEKEKETPAAITPAAITPAPTASLERKKKQNKKPSPPVSASVQRSFSSSSNIALKEKKRTKSRPTTPVTRETLLYKKGMVFQRHHYICSIHTVDAAPHSLSPIDVRVVRVERGGAMVVEKEDKEINVSSSSSTADSGSGLIIRSMTKEQVTRGWIVARDMFGQNLQTEYFYTWLCQETISFQEIPRRRDQKSITLRRQNDLVVIAVPEVDGGGRPWSFNIVGWSERRKERKGEGNSSSSSMCSSSMCSSSMIEERKRDETAKEDVLSKIVESAYTCVVGALSTVRHISAHNEEQRQNFEGKELNEMEEAGRHVETLETLIGLSKGNVEERRRLVRAVAARVATGKTSMMPPCEVLHLVCDLEVAGAAAGETCDVSIVETPFTYNEAISATITTTAASYQEEEVEEDEEDAPLVWQVVVRGRQKTWSSHIAPPIALESEEDVLTWCDNVCRQVKINNNKN